MTPGDTSNKSANEESDMATETAEILVSIKEIAIPTQSQNVEENVATDETTPMSPTLPPLPGVTPEEEEFFNAEDWSQRHEDVLNDQEETPAPMAESSRVTPNVARHVHETTSPIPEEEIHLFDEQWSQVLKKYNITVGKSSKDPEWEYSSENESEDESLVHSDEEDLEVSNDDDAASEGSIHFKKMSK